MRVLIADDELPVRSALRLLLEQQFGVQQIDEAGTAEALAECIRSGCFDLLLLDWELDSAAGAGGLSELHGRCPRMRIVVLSSQPEVGSVAIGAGASHFVCKGDPPERLLEAIHLDSTASGASQS